MQLTRPVLTFRQAAALGQAVEVDRWRAALLRSAAVAVGAVLDDASGWPPLTEKACDELRQALATITMRALALEAESGVGHERR
jgi:hypothetical protein